MITTTYNYQETLAASVKANWRVGDIIGGDKRLDFTRPFMPDSLARVNSIDFLSGDEKILLNQIRGYGYLCTFGLVEEFILPFVLDHVRPQLNQDDYRTRALLQFASEEAKHIHLFKKFAEEFKEGPIRTFWRLLASSAQVCESELKRWRRCSRDEITRCSGQHKTLAADKRR